MIDYDFQGFVNNKYIIKAKSDKFSISVEADSLEDAQAKAKEKLIELSKTAETQIQNTKQHRKPKHKIRYRFNI